MAELTEAELTERDDVAEAELSERDDIAAHYATLDDIPYYTVRGGTYARHFHPKQPESAEIHNCRSMVLSETRNVGNAKHETCAKHET